MRHDTREAKPARIPLGGIGMMAAESLGISPAFAAISDGGGEPPVGAPWRSNNPALTGAFEPIFEERDDADLQIQGEIPAGLNGVFMRNGPNPRFEPDARYAYPLPHANLANTNIVHHGGRYLALYEGGKPYELDSGIGTLGGSITRANCLV